MTYFAIGIILAIVLALVAVTMVSYRFFSPIRSPTEEDRKRYHFSEREFIEGEKSEKFYALVKSLIFIVAGVVLTVFAWPALISVGIGYLISRSHTSKKARK